MKLREIRQKIVGPSLHLTLSAAIALTPLASYSAASAPTNGSTAAADTTAASSLAGSQIATQQNPASEQTNADLKITRTQKAQKLADTAKAQKAYIDTALYYIKKNDLIKGLQYLDGAATVANSAVFDVAIQDRINEAITTAPQQLPDGTSAGKVIIPDFPTFVPQDIPTANNPTPQTSSNDGQIQKLNDLMRTNPQLRNLLWQVANERLGTTVGDIGVNPGIYAPTPPTVASHAVCNQYSIMCAVLTGGGILDVDYTTNIMELKNRAYGLPLDVLADELIRKQVLIAGGVSFFGPLLSGFPKNASQQQIGWGVNVDLTPSIALYYSSYMIIGQLAPLYNYALNAGNKESLALVALAMARVYRPLFRTVKNVAQRSALIQGIMAGPLWRKVADTISSSTRTGKPLSQAMAELMRSDASVFAEVSKAMRSMGVPIIPMVQKPKETQFVAKNATNVNAVLDPIFPDPAIGPMPGGQSPGGINPNPGGGSNPFPIPPPTNPTDPQPPIPDEPKISLKMRALQWGMMALDMAKGGAYGVGEAEVIGLLAKQLFRTAYLNDRMEQAIKFRMFLRSGANTKFLKLLILSQRPEVLVVSNPPSQFPNPVPTTPTAPGTKPVVAPGNGFPFPARLAQMPPVPNAPPVPEPTQKRRPHKVYGGNPESFILNLTRYLHFCSVDDVDNAADAKEEIMGLIRQHPELNSWDSLSSQEKKSTPFLSTLFRQSERNESLQSLYLAKKITADQVRKIQLIHDCDGRPDTDRYDEIKKEMITYSVLSDADIAVLRRADINIRLHMSELILQLLYLNGKPNDVSLDYFEKVKVLLGLNVASFDTYFQFYEAELETPMYEPYVFSPTGYHLRNRPSVNPYDGTVLDEKRPDEPQSLNPPTKVVPVNGNSGGFGGFGGIGGFGSVGGGYNTPSVDGQFPFKQ